MNINNFTESYDVTHPSFTKKLTILCLYGYELKDDLKEWNGYWGGLVIGKQVFHPLFTDNLSNFYNTSGPATDG